jgi:hypothetical protein
VDFLKVLLVDMRVGVWLPIVAVFMLVFDVLVIMQAVRVGVGHIPVGVLMGVLLHRLLLLAVRSQRRDLATMTRKIGLHQRMLHAQKGLPASASAMQINAPALQLVRWCRCLSLLSRNG